ncbi:MAG: hypothetical protein HYW26_00085 [Candidatus Aenigmarchaeota archaeon]|nr:hypothetical protein [Candidatus Aenigmarchaeota archaeon]
MYPRLVLVTGVIGSGKTTVRRFLQEELAFAGVSHDEMIEQAYGVPYAKFRLWPDYEEIFPAVRKASYILRNIRLIGGRDLAMEGAYRRQQDRANALITGFSDEKYLLVINVDRGILERRVRDEGKSLELLSEQLSQWERISPDCSEELGCEVIIYQNNTPEDMKAIQADLRRRFERKREIFVPATS